jgi:CDP-glycerol glycerophosphotransferase (TagB/SpsB family)
MREKPRDSRPTVAVSFHWDCKVTEETGSTFEEYHDAVLELSRESAINLIGHAHPSFPRLFDWYGANGIEAVRSIDDVFERADLYACDNSSTLYEFASLDRPVVVINGERYRRGVKYGLRFWELADVGINCDAPKDLTRRVMEALEDPDPVAVRREEISADLFPHPYDAAKVAAVTIEDLVS